MHLVSDSTENVYTCIYCMEVTGNLENKVWSYIKFPLLLVLCDLIKLTQVCFHSTHLEMHLWISKVHIQFRAEKKIWNHDIL